MAAISADPQSNSEARGLVPGPAKPAGLGLIAIMALGQFGLFLALLTPVFSSLAIKIQTLVPVPEAVGALGLVSSLGAVAAFLANPVFGRISDRTTGRFGRRRPWLVLGALGLIAGLAVIATATSVAVIAVGWFFSQMAANAAYAAYNASIADQVPSSQRGKVTALVGVMVNLSILGAAYAAEFLGTRMLQLFLVPSVIGLVLVLIYVVVLPDRPLPQRPPSEGWRTVVKTFWVSPRQHPDFAWVFTSRFAVILASFMFTTFRLLFIQHQLHLDTAKSVSVMATGVLIYTIVLMVSGQIAGWASDRLRRRKAFVVMASLIFGLGTAQLLMVGSVGSFYVAEAVLGLGFGIYTGVDMALVLDVLPNPDDAAKDLGVFNIASAAPQALAPALGGALFGVSGNYGLLLGVAAGICVLGALAILPVKKVR